MTGFGRAQGEHAGCGWVWELRAVNGKGLDVRLRLPNGFEQLEQSVRKLCSTKLARGNVQANLTVDQPAENAGVQVNQAVLDKLLQSISSIDDRAETSPSSAAQILALRGVLEPADNTIDAEEREALNSELLNGLEMALESLNANRKAEGAALAGVLNGHMDTVTDLVAKAEADPSRTPEVISARLREQLSRLDLDDGKIDPDRVHQEAAILATKADIREELDRLTAHIDAARTLLATEGSVGRKLEFLAQEFNRESNTLCSKSNAVSLTETGLELKVVIDQFREQILNVE